MIYRRVFNIGGTELKKISCVAIAVVVLVLTSAVPGHAGAYWRGGIWVGPGFGVGCGPFWGSPWPGPLWGPRVYWGGPFWGLPYPYYAGPSVAVQQSPPVYVEPAPQPDQTYYWYYCQKPKGYYPYIKECPGGWMKVVPSPAPADR
jgi:hypothetical protein